MMTTRKLLIAACVFAIPALLVAQKSGLDPKDIYKPLAESWTSYSGDYTGRRYSALKQINHSTVKNLTLAWVTRVTGGSGPEGRGAATAGRGGAPAAGGVP